MATTTPANQSTSSGYYGIVAWSITILLFLLLAKTKIGYTILLYFVIASLIIVIAVGSPTISNVFKAASTKAT
jgi:hypothetical protein